MDRPGRQASPPALRRALTDRLRTIAQDGRWDLPQLQRQFAYDRLLARLYAADDGWVLKGATALIARGIAVRATLDVDVYRSQPVAQVEREFRDAVMQDMGDHFSFELGPGQPVNDGTGVRVRVEALLGATPWAQFHVDLVGSEVRMTGRPERVPAMAAVGILGIRQDGYRVYPLADHIADKACAILQRYGDLELPSTRFKDLVDLVAIISVASIEAMAQMEALELEAERRGLVLPDAFDVPDHALWQTGYAAEAARSTLPITGSVTGAIRIVGGYVDPVFNKTAHGRWDPDVARWRSDGPSGSRLTTTR